MACEVGAVVAHGHGLGKVPATRTAPRCGSRREGVAREDSRPLRRRGRCVPGKRDQLVGAVAENDLRGRHPELLREPLLEREGCAVGIQIGLFERGLDRGHRERTRPQRVLVRGELDRIGDAVFPGHLVDRLSRNIGGQRFDVGRNERRDHAAGVYRTRCRLGQGGRAPLCVATIRPPAPKRHRGSGSACSDRRSAPPVPG